jgi:hypothetical protein
MKKNLFLILIIFAFGFFFAQKASAGCSGTATWAHPDTDCGQLYLNCGAYESCCSVSSCANAGYTCAKARDADPMGTYWATDCVSRPQWIEFDLGQTTCIAGAQVWIFDPILPVTMNIQISNDRASWTNVVTGWTYSDDSAPASRSFGEVTTRYIRVSETNFPSQGWCSGGLGAASLSDFQILTQPFSSFVVPTVTTDLATVNTSNNTASLIGNVTNTGGENPDHRYIDWDTNSGVPYANTVDLGAGGAGTYSTNIAVSPNTTYYYRARAHNSAGEGTGSERRAVIYVADGAEQQFTTNSGNNSPTVQNLNLDSFQNTVCGITGGARARFRWTFVDVGDTQRDYQIQADDNSDFSSPVINVTSYNNNSQSFVNDLSSLLNWNTVYYWRVKVWDSVGNSSGWFYPPSSSVAPGVSFTTPSHAYPYPSFTFLPARPTLDTIVSFTDDSNCYSSPGNTEGNCSLASYAWDFNNDGITDSAKNGSATTSYNTTGIKTINLRITDSLGSCSISVNLNVGVKVPDWQEVPPIMWLRAFFAQINFGLASLF